MKALHQVCLSLLVAMSVLALIGCGVSKEEHERAVTELSRVKAELDKTVIELNNTKKDLAQAMSRNAGLEQAFSEVQAKLKSASAGAAATMSTAAQDLQAKVKNLTSENAALKQMIDKLKQDYGEIQKKLGGGVQSPAPQMPGGLPKKP